MKMIMLAAALAASLLTAACDDDQQASVNIGADNYVEAAPYPDGTQK